MKELLPKLLSGRFILTIIVGIVFAILAIKGLLDQNKVTEIILIVIYAYFTKERNKKEGT